VRATLSGSRGHGAAYTPPDPPPRPAPTILLLLLLLLLLVPFQPRPTPFNPIEPRNRGNSLTRPPLAAPFCPFPTEARTSRNGRRDFGLPTSVSRCAPPRLPISSRPTFHYSRSLVARILEASFEHRWRMNLLPLSPHSHSYSHSYSHSNFHSLSLVTGSTNVS
jgi:hypothetical protein